jgi:hopene-associated glycosyltransferase HpnB
MVWFALSLVGAIFWLALLSLPWRPWGVREVLEAENEPKGTDLSGITALIPARNEAATITGTLQSLEAQGRGLKTLLVDDQSSDGTATIARRCARQELHVIPGRPLPVGWTGKLWALEQGRAHLDRPLTLLLDADIVLAPGMLGALRAKMQRERLAFVSVMAALRMQTFWERLLLPTFVFFFRLLYPFQLSNDPRWRSIAAAAGGCILLETRLLDRIGGFQVLRDALIDDCALARRVKALGVATWVGVTHGARSTRHYDDLASIWNMVARTAFTQLHYSMGILLGCTAIFMIAFWMPLAALFSPEIGARVVAALALATMMAAYIPTVRFYRLSALWSLALPLIGTLYLAMTWTSAVRYWSGRRSQWKDRLYARASGSNPSR